MILPAFLYVLWGGRKEASSFFFSKEGDDRPHRVSRLVRIRTTTAAFSKREFAVKATTTRRCCRERKRITETTDDAAPPVTVVAFRSPQDRRGGRREGESRADGVRRLDRYDKRSFASLRGTRVADLRPRPTLPETCLRTTPMESTSSGAPAGWVAASYLGTRRVSALLSLRLSRDRGADTTPASRGRRRPAGLTPRAGAPVRSPPATPRP